MDIALLKAFMEVEQLGSLRGAASRLNISQPALSRQIQRLEAEVGSELFERTGRGMKLSEAGEKLKGRANQLIQDWDEVLASIHGGDQPSGTVCLVVPPSFSPKKCAVILGRLRASYPLIKVRIAVALSGLVHRGLLSGSIDLGILYSSVSAEGLYFSNLWKESLSLITLAEKAPRTKSVVLKAVLERELLLPSSGHGLRELVQGAATGLGLPLRLAMEIDSLRHMLAMVDAGHGDTILPAASVSQRLERMELAATPIANPELSRTVVLAHSTQHRQRRAVKVVFEYLEEAFRELSPEEQ